MRRGEEGEAFLPHSPWRTIKVSQTRVNETVFIEAERCGVQFDAELFCPIRPATWAPNPLAHPLPLRRSPPIALERDSCV